MMHGQTKIQVYIPHYKLKGDVANSNEG